jgi:hypothetical protein
MNASRRNQLRAGDVLCAVDLRRTRPLGQVRPAGSKYPVGSRSGAKSRGSGKERFHTRARARASRVNRERVAGLPHPRRRKGPSAGCRVRAARHPAAGPDMQRVVAVLGQETMRVPNDASSAARHRHRANSRAYGNANGIGRSAATAAAVAHRSAPARSGSPSHLHLFPERSSAGAACRPVLLIYRHPRQNPAPLLPPRAPPSSGSPPPLRRHLPAERPRSWRIWSSARALLNPDLASAPARPDSVASAGGRLVLKIPICLSSQQSGDALAPLVDPVRAAAWPARWQTGRSFSIRKVSARPAGGNLDRQSRR